MNITVPQLITLSISDHDAKNITVAFLCEKFDWDVDFRIFNGDVVKIFPENSGRGVTRSLPPQFIREASPQDQMINNLFEILLDD